MEYHWLHSKESTIITNVLDMPTLNCLRSFDHAAIKITVIIALTLKVQCSSYSIITATTLFFPQML